MISQSDTKLPQKIIHGMYGALIILWFLAGLLTPRGLPFSPLNFGSNLGPEIGLPPLPLLLDLGSWLMLALAFWKIVALFISKWFPRLTAPDELISISSGILLSTGTLGFLVFHIISQARSAEYFAQIAPLLWLFTPLNLAYNAWMIVGLLNLIGRSNPTWAEYQHYRQAIKNQRPSIRDLVSAWGIQRRLVVSFVTIIFIIISVLSWALLDGFSGTILSSVQDAGLKMAERTAAIVKTSIHDPIIIDDYFRLEGSRNSQSTTPFHYLEFVSIGKGTEGPRIVYSSNPERIGLSSQEHLIPSDRQEAEPWITEGLGGRTIEFYAPVHLGGKLLGYAAAVYEQEQIMEPYFRTQVKVYLLASFFIYVSIFLTFLFGRNIVIPILFLRMSVSGIAKTLDEMIRGMRRISSAPLEFKDRVGTRDEIKDLSMEIGNMTSVIRGVIPYISAATLMNADKGISSEERELAFLFTDIRGFTTMCEGMQAAEVVGLLNHYLDLQTAVILANGGDVDKFVGDEIMASFDGPDKEIKACRASIAIREAMAAAREQTLSSFNRVVEIGVGINTGPVVFGSVGSRDRMDFTSIGDTVNLAARLEGANKNYGTRSLISEAVYRKVSSEFLCREIDLITVVGKKRPVRIFEIIGTVADTGPEQLHLAKQFETALLAYRTQDWDSAQSMFFELWQTTEDEASAVFLRRIDLFRKAKPEPDWDGVFALTFK
jgi:adenylate cyclase